MFKQLTVMALMLALAACNPKQDTAQQQQAQDLRVSITALEGELKNAKGKLINYDRGLLIIEQYQQYARSLPKDSLAPVYLFRAADVARGIGDFPLAITLWGKVNKDYPDYERAPEALFLQGLTAENDRKDKAAAQAFYSDFLTRYPRHPLSKDAQLLLDYIKSGKSAEDLIRDFKDRPAPTE
jgi:tetratricopeptide (TPR) repeat protein